MSSLAGIFSGSTAGLIFETLLVLGIVWLGIKAHSMKSALETAGVLLAHAYEEKDEIQERVIEVKQLLGSARASRNSFQTQLEAANEEIERLISKPTLYFRVFQAGSNQTVGHCTTELLDDVVLDHPGRGLWFELITREEYKAAVLEAA